MNSHSVNIWVSQSALPLVESPGEVRLRLYCSNGAPRRTFNWSGVRSRVSTSAVVALVLLALVRLVHLVSLRSMSSFVFSRIIETTTPPCAVVSPQHSYACQPPFIAEASLHAPHLSLWVLFIFVPPLFPSLALRFVSLLFWGSEDNPRLSGSCDRDSEDNPDSHVPGPTWASSQSVMRTSNSLKNLRTSVGLARARPNINVPSKRRRYGTNQLY